MIDELSKALINHYQRGMPLSPTPYADIAARFGIAEAEVISCLQSLLEDGIVSRVGPVFNHCSAGASTLAAIAVPENELASVAELINAYAEVNHNYAREHRFNLWFVITAPTEPHIEQVVASIEKRTGYPVINLPMEKSYHIDLAFPIEWQENELCS